MSQNILVSFEASGRDEVRAQVLKHPLLNGHQFLNNTYGTFPINVDFQSGYLKFINGFTAVSYVLDVNKDQTKEATFDNPVTATTKWSAPLNVAVAYN